MNLERIAYVLLALSGAAMIVMTIQEAEASPAEAIVAGGFAIGLGLLFVKALRDRLRNAEDDHYDKTVDL